jgi:2'-5' RNA ligase
MLPSRVFLGLDIPEPLRARILEIRRERDPGRLHLPVEIPLSGAGTIGALELRQDPDEVFAALDEFARQHGPVTTSFARIIHFPSEILYLEPREREALTELHLAIQQIGLQFRREDPPYIPNCAVAKLGASGEVEAFRTLGPSFSNELHTLETLSAYALWAGDGKLELLHQCRLTGAAVNSGAAKLDRRYQAGQKRSCTNSVSREPGS